MNRTDIEARYKVISRMRGRYFTILSLALLALALVSVLMGPGNITVTDLGQAIRGEGNPLHRHILYSIRMPRTLAAILSGMALALAGGVMQSVLRNPLGSPFTLGISNSAAFGAALAILAGSGSLAWFSHPVGVTLSAFLFSLVACIFILAIAGKRGATPENMVLAGIIASTLFAALTSALQFLADDARLASIVYWTFGDLSKVTWNALLIQTLIIVPAVIYFVRNARHFNALDLGDETAQSLGVNVPKFRTLSMVIASLVTAAVVAFYGIIAFVGLVIPHIVRRTIGGNETYLIPASALTGAVFLLLCDTLARTLFSPVVLPVGIITSIIGAPVFMLLLVKSRRVGQWRF